MACGIMVIGCGNTWASDDAIGIRVVEFLKKSYDIPSDVTIVEAGCPGIDLLFIWEDVPAVILVDAVTGFGMPGTIHTFDADHLLPREKMPYSSHSINVIDAIELGKKFRQLPCLLTIVGIEIKSEESFCLKLSPEVEEALPAACETIFREIEKIRCASSLTADTPL
ncbi:MAG: hydrogenase maturation protease [Peptococcaceae bacterium]|nr:hydrogenase maturation protease [Peptococcaceae bacterium]